MYMEMFVVGGYFIFFQIILPVYHLMMIEFNVWIF